MKMIHCRLDGKSGHEAGRELLARLYREETGKPLPEIRIQEWGKPYFAEGGYHFSITHTKHYAFCALSENNIGIDAEELDRKLNLKLADKVLSPMEKEQFDASEDKVRAFLTFWVLKEAEVKLTGEGLQGYPNHTNISLDDPRVTEIAGCLVAVLEEKGDKTHAV